MKVLFALSTDKVSDLIVQRYQQKYGEMLDFKKVYFFDAILRELEKDTSYDSIIIDESLEGKFKDDDLVKRIATISTVAVKGDNTKIPLILILTPERVAGVPILYSLYNIGINNALLGTDRKFSKICELIVKPRTAKEAKDYYVIDAKDPDFEEQVVEIVPEAQVVNIKRFYKNVEADKYSETFDKIASQYSDVELLYIIGKLPNEVKDVLKNSNNKYNEIIKNSSSIQTQIKEATQKKLNTNNLANKQGNAEDPFSNESMLKRQEYIQNINMNNNPQQFNQNVDNNNANNANNINNTSNAENVTANVSAEEEPKKEEQQPLVQDENTKIEMEKPEERKELKEQVQPTQVEEKKEVVGDAQEVEIEKEDVPNQTDLANNVAITNNEEEKKQQEENEVKKAEQTEQTEQPKEETSKVEKEENASDKKEESTEATDVDQEIENLKKELEEFSLEESESETEQKVETKKEQEEPKVGKENNNVNNEKEIEIEKENETKKEEIKPKQEEVEVEEKENNSNSNNNNIVDDKDIEIDFEEEIEEPKKVTLGNVQEEKENVTEEKAEDKPEKVEEVKVEAKEETNNNNNNNVNTGIESAHNNNSDNNETKAVQKPIRIDSINNDRVSEDIEDIGLDETNIKDVERGFEKSKKEETDKRLEASNNVIVAEDNRPKQQEKEKNLDIEEIKNIGDIIPEEVDKKIEANAGHNGSESESKKEKEEEREAENPNTNADENTEKNIEKNINTTNKPIGNAVENNNTNNNPNNNANNLSDNNQQQNNQINKNNQNNQQNNLNNNINNQPIQNKPVQNMGNNQRNNMHVPNNMNNNANMPGMHNQNMNANANMQNIHNMNNMNNMRNMQNMQKNNNFRGRENFDPKILEKYVNNKSAIFIGTSKSGVTFMINSLAMIFASIGINTAILDMTRNKNSYYMTTDNNEELRNIAAESINKLKHGIAEGIQLNRNLTMYTGTPFDNSCYGDEGKVLTTLYNNHTVVLIDADYSTPKEYFAYANNIYAIQTLDVLTMQPLTHFMKDLKKANILNDEKIKVIINKELPVKGLNKKLMIGGLSTYNSPTMSSMEQLFNRNTVSVFSVPFDVGVYQRYLTNIVECKLDITGYPKPFIEQLKLIANDIYTLENKSKEKIVIQNEFRPEGGPNMKNGNGMNNTGNMRRY